MSDNDLPEREMTLHEWLAELPETHAANVELAALERELADTRASLARAAQDRDISMQKRGELERELAEARAELETERIQLTACGVAAMQNTVASVAERITRDNPYWSASYGDVCAAVDREMALRAEAERAFREGYDAGGADMSAAHHNEYYVGYDAAWLASDARKRVRI